MMAFADAGRAEVTHHGSPETYRAILPRLAPGDTLLLDPGVYHEGLPLHAMRGEPGRPITVAGPAAGPPARFVGRADANTVSIVDSEYLVVRDLLLDGRNLPVDGVKAEGHARYAHHITLENLVIRGHGNNQQIVGISTKCPAWGWVLRGNTIVGAGTGMYLGSSDGSAPFVAGIIENNLIVNTTGYNLQIKHQHARPELPGMPSGRSVTLIRRNVFSKTAGGSREQARPNVLVGHFPLDGPGADDRYVIYANLFFQNLHEALFQGEGNVALYNNLFVNQHGDAIRIQPHNDIPRRVDIAFNTVLAKGGGITVVRGETSFPWRHAVSANAVFAGVPLSGGEQSGNLAAPLAEARRRLNRPFAPPGQLDLFPASRRGMVAGTIPPNPDGLPEWDRDFNGQPRTQGLVGAYGNAGRNPGRLPRLERMR